ncbi:hypothetical protein PVAND_016707 [Polypedilum vanderplanki]|uniref:Ionotropic receptor n=1 Tax=Polypedilum vanderplanki TaxID=319348 RepID=A0A9J6BG78_POLVA|nr:hypothetical protein PVAND_016707 [Polypedilum vanderplanki]
MIFKQNNIGIFYLVSSIASIFCTSFALNTKLLQKVPNRNPVQLAKVMVDVIHEFYIVNNIKFDFIIYGKATNHIKDVINEVTKDLANEIPINIKQIDIKIWNHILYQSAIVFTKSKKNLRTLHKKSINTDELNLSLGNVFPKQFKFLTYVEEIENFDKADTELFFPSFSYLRPDMRMFEIYITMDKISINLTANVLFSKNKCGKFHLKRLNSFNLKTQKWKKELKNFNHFDNFHGCLMSFLVEVNIFWYFDNYFSIFYEGNSLKKFALGNIKFHGLTHEILEKLTKDLNITGHYTYHDRILKIGTGSKNFLANNAIASYFYSSEIVRSSTYLHWSNPIYTMEIYYLVTQNDLYTNYEKLLMPFDLITWILLTIVLFLTFCIIFVSYLCPRKFQMLVFGEGIRNPSYNALGVIFGIGQLRLPHKFFNRVILLIFLWFCLIFRTCYQSKFFEFMTSDMRKPLPASIEDLKEMNYTIVLEASLAKICERLNDEIINSRERPNIIGVNRIEFKYLYERAN